MANFDVGNLLSAVSGLEKTEPLRTGVDFSGKGLSLDNENDVQPIVEAIEECGHLEHLNLRGNTLGVAGARGLSKALASHPELRRALWSDLFTGRMKTEIPEALSALGDGMMLSGARLTELDLCDNAFGPIGVRGLAALLRSPVCSQLQELKLNNNGLGVTGSKLLAEALTPAPPTLRVLVMGRNRLENPGAIALASILKTITSLEHLSVPQNGIYHIGISALASALEGHPNLKHLDLNDNTVRRKGAAALAAVLPRLQHLRHANFGDCLLKASGARLLLTAMHSHLPALKELNLSFNEIGKSAGPDLISEITVRPELQIELQSNPLGSVTRRTLSSLGQRVRLKGEDDDSEEDDDDDDEEESEESTGEADKTGDDSGASSGGEEEDIPKKQNGSEPMPLDSSLVNTDSTPVGRFLSNPSLQYFTELGATPAEALIEDAKKHTDDLAYVDSLVIATMSVSGLKQKEASEKLYRELVDWSERRPGRQWGLANALLSHLRLIKSENSKSPLWDLDNCAVMLATFITETWFPSGLRDTLRFFVQNKADKRFQQHPSLVVA